MKLNKILLSIAVLALPLIAKAQVEIKLDSKSSPLPVESKSSKGNALVQILLPEMELIKANLSGDVTFVGDLKKIVGGYEIWISTENKNHSNLIITNPANPDDRLPVNLADKDNRKFLQKIFQRNPSRLMSDKKYVVRLSLVNNGGRLTPALASGNLVENTNPIKNIQWEKDNQGKPMALVYLKTNGINGPIQVEEQSGLMKGEPKAYEDGMLVWITPQKKGSTTLLIRSDNYTEGKLTSSNLIGGKQYIGSITCTDTIYSKAFINLASDNPCTIKITSSSGKILTRDLAKEYKKLNLPYGAYSYIAQAPDRIDESGTFFINGMDVNKKIELLSNTGLLRITTEVGNVVKLDQRLQAPIRTDSVNGTYEITAKMGEHNLNISRNGIVGLDEDITIQPAQNLSLNKPITGKLEINKRLGATICIINGLNKSDTIVSNGRTPYTLNNALGSYYVIGNKKKYESTSDEIYVKPLQTQEVHVTGKRIIAPLTFLSYVYTPKAPFGLMIGHAKRWGWYLAFKSSENFWRSIDGASPDNKTDAYKIAMYHAVLPNQWSKYNINTESLTKEKPIRFSGTIGLMKSIKWWLYVYAGAGYGLYQTLYENPSPKVEASAEVKLDNDQKGTKLYYADQYFSTYKIEGIEAEAGIMLNFHHVNINLGWTHLFGNKLVSEPVAGIGVNF